jgi:hypothetical protein
MTLELTLIGSAVVALLAVGFTAGFAFATARARRQQRRELLELLLELELQRRRRLGDTIRARAARAGEGGHQ